MQENFTKNIIDDDVFDNIGVYTEPLPLNAKRYDIKKIIEYCESHNVIASELSDEEREQFVVQ